MTKIISILLLMITLLSVSMSVFAIDTTTDSITLYINKNEAQATELTDTAYWDADGNIMIPLRQTMEAFGYKVEWVEDTQSIVIKESPVGTLTMKIGEKSVTYNGKAEFMAGSATLKDSKTYIPLNAMEILKHSTVVSISPDNTNVTICCSMEK